MSRQSSSAGAPLLTLLARSVLGDLAARDASTPYSIAARLHLEEGDVRRGLRELEREGYAMRCRAGGPWGGSWWTTDTAQAVR